MPCCSGKACCGCGAACLVLLAGCGLAGYFYAPTMAQNIMDTAEVSISNCTMYACSATTDGHARLYTHLNMKVKSPLGSIKSTLVAGQQTLSTTTCLGEFGLDGGYACKNANTSLLGSYTSPDLSVADGDNGLDMVIDLTYQSNDNIMNGFISPMFFIGYKSRLYLDAHDATVSVMGYKIKGLKIHKTMTCEHLAVLDQMNLPNSLCYPKDPSHTPADSSQGFAIHCTTGDDPLTTESPTPAPASLTSYAEVAEVFA